MTEDKNFLQSIKLEISRNFKLDPYERIAFHRVLACAKSAAGRDILVREIEKEGDIRLSALRALLEFNDPSLLPVFIDVMKKNPVHQELLIIIDYLYQFGTESEVKLLIEIARERKNYQNESFLIKKTFNALKKIGANDKEFHNYIQSIIADQEADPVLLEGAINAASILKKPALFEELIKRNSPSITEQVFTSIYHLNQQLVVEEEVEKDEYTPPVLNPDNSMSSEDELLLNIKVLLGKVTSKFEDFNIDTKIAYLNAMLSCNHRESVIYVTKALESRNSELIRKTLFSLYGNITKLRFPEKLLRSLISMSLESEENNRLIVEIFVKYFTEKNRSRSDVLFRDKLFGNIASTLESYFETYRREFMIPDVMESALPDNFKKINKCILEHFNPEQKRRLVTELISGDKNLPGRILPYFGEWIKYLNNEDLEPFSLLIDLLIDDDKISRENSAARLDVVNFEKRYLRSRIIRLCNIVNFLNIDGAAKLLVYIYSYLKKYSDPGIFDSAVSALCRINYSYMLSEVEIMLTAGSPEDQVRAVSLLPLFTEKRLLNVLVEYLKVNASIDSEITKGIVSILADQEVKQNINAIEVFKQVIQSNSNPDIVCLAITGVGNCCLAEDIEYLNEIFYKVKEQRLKEAVVKGICSIISFRNDYNKQQIMRFVQEYLKDPDIRVRIFSCMILIRLGNKDAFRSIREMLIIKNKIIQREILSILRDIRTPDFYFFLVSLLKEEFGISEDIICMIRKLPADELKEIESFIINIFRKFEIPAIGSGNVKEISKLERAEKRKITVLHLTLENFGIITAGMNFYELIEFYLKIDSFVMKPVISNNGIISDKDNNFIVAWFSNPLDSISAANEVIENFTNYNNTVVYRKNIKTGITLKTVECLLVGDEIFDFTTNRISNLNYAMPLGNKAVLDDETAASVSDDYYSAPIPEILYSGNFSDRNHSELISKMNFIRVTTEMVEQKQKEIKRTREEQAQLAAQIKNLRTGNRSTTSIAIAGELENIGIKLKDQLEEIEKYVNRRTTDRDLSKNVRLMLNNAYNLYRVEISKLTIK